MICDQVYDNKLHAPSVIKCVFCFVVVLLLLLFYVLVQLYPAPSEGQRSRAVATMKILKTVILVLS